MKRDVFPLSLLVAALIASSAAMGTTASPPASASGTVTQTSTTASDAASVPDAGQTQAVTRVAAPFATLAGSTDNAVALATALRTGSAATLTTTSVDAAGVEVTTTTTFTPPTKPMGWGNVSHALDLAQFALNDAGIASPTQAENKS